MSAILAGSGLLRDVAPVAAATAPTAARQRDLRLDFVRGVALLMIFIDHVSGNRFAALTLQSLGFADAAEVFVFIAGIAAVLAYRKSFAESFGTGLKAVLARITTLYLAHLAMVAGMIVLAAGALLSGTGFDMVAKLGLQPLLDDPMQALLRLPALAFLPHYMDILPLYIALFATLPVMFLAMRLHVSIPLTLAFVAYVGAQATGLNLPSFGNENGWFLNPFSWLMLFALGMTTAELARSGAFQGLPRVMFLGITFAAAGYAVFAFLHAAPWRVFPALADIAGLSGMFLPDKTLLSWHRLVDIAAKAWLVAVLVPPTARFMATGVGGAITRAGRNSLPVFIAGVMLAMLGSVVLYEAEGHAFAHILVTFAGVAALLTLALMVERWNARPIRFSAAQPVPPSSATNQQQN